MKRIIFLSQAIMLLSAPFLASGAPDCSATPGYTLLSGVCVPSDTGLSDADISVIAKNVMLWLIGIFGALAVIAFIISGIQYLTSAGDEKSIETAKRNMKWSIVGVIVGLSGLIIIMAVSMLLSGTGG